MQQQHYAWRCAQPSPILARPLAVFLAADPSQRWDWYYFPSVEVQFSLYTLGYI